MFMDTQNTRRRVTVRRNYIWKNQKYQNVSAVTNIKLAFRPDIVLKYIRHRMLKVKFVDVKCGLKFTEVSLKSIRYWSNCSDPLELPLKCGLYRTYTGHCWHRLYRTGNSADRQYLKACQCWFIGVNCFPQSLDPHRMLFKITSSLRLTLELHCH